MKSNYLEDMVGKLQPFEKLYNVIRVVDPLINKVLYLKGDDLIQMESTCFAFWSKDQQCTNCISLRAHVEKDTFVKMEYTEDKIYMTTALPVTIKDREVVIELLKDVTNSLITEDENFNRNPEIYTMIEAINTFALKDTLTNAYNRRYINETLTLDLIKAILTDKPISLILADIDLFKEVNDNHGHLVGDNVLKHFANILIDTLGAEEGWVARYGGEEFLCCLKDLTQEKVVEIAEKMRLRIEKTAFYSGDDEIFITASFGVYSAKPQAGTQVSELLNLVDKKLYEAKAKGRNRVEF